MTLLFYKRATERVLHACMICSQLNGSKHEIVNFTEIALSTFNNFNIKKGGHITFPKLKQLFTCITLFYLREWGATL